MVVNPLDAANEFEDGVAAAEAAAAKAEADKAKADADAKEKDDLKKEVSTLRQTLDEKLKGIDELTTKVAVVDRIKDALGVKASDPKDEFITAEIKRRLGSDLTDVAKIKELIPVMLEMMGSMAEERLQERVDTAQETLKAEMDKLGLDTKDKETVAAMEEAVTSIIRADKDLNAAWARGNSKKAVKDAFAKLEQKLYAPVRSKLKRAAVNTLLDGPKPSPRGGAPAPAPAGKGSNTVDTRDTSREGIKKVHDAAFDRLQELLDQ